MDLSYLYSDKNYPKTVKENINILQSYFNLLKDNNIKPIIIVFPCNSYYYEKFSKELEKRFYETINFLKTKAEFEFYDYFKSNIFYDDDFIDISHLNKKGSKKMCEIINSILCE